MQQVQGVFHTATQTDYRIISRMFFENGGSNQQNTACKHVLPFRPIKLKSNLQKHKHDVIASCESGNNLGRLDRSETTRLLNQNLEKFTRKILKFKKLILNLPVSLSLFLNQRFSIALSVTK